MISARGHGIESFDGRVKEEPACKPDSVGGARASPGGHLSEGLRRPSGALALVRPTRDLERATLERSLLGLAPGGVCRAGPIARSAGELLPHRFTLTGGEPPAVCFLWPFPRVAPPGCYPAPRPVESGLSSRRRSTGTSPAPPSRGRPAGSSTSHQV